MYIRRRGAHAYESPSVAITTETEYMSTRLLRCRRSAVDDDDDDSVLHNA